MSSTASFVTEHADAVLTALGVLGTAFLGLIGTMLPLLVSTRRHARRADAQVSNNHVDEDGNPINLREENDDRHAETLALLSAVLEEQGHTRRDIGGMRAELRAVRSDVSELYSRTDENRTYISHLQKGTPAWESTPQTSGPTREHAASAPSRKDSPWT